MKRISDIMDRKLVAVAPSATVKSALKLAENSGVDLILIVDNERLVGVILQEELQDYLTANPNSANQVANIAKRPIFVAASDTVSSAVGKAMENNISRLPVVDSLATMKCVGVVTATELLKAAAEKK